MNEYSTNHNFYGCGCFHELKVKKEGKLNIVDIEPYEYSSYYLQYHGIDIDGNLLVYLLSFNGNTKGDGRGYGRGYNDRGW